MAWIEQIARRTQTAKTWRDSENPSKHHFEQVLKTPLHYPTAGPDSGLYDGVVDMTPVRIDNPQLDGWRIVNAGWHYALGKPGDKDTDGWVGFGGRQGQHWIKFRLAKVGYLHSPTRQWEDVGGTPNYDRANLSRETSTLTIGPNNDEIKAASKATWENIWTTPGGGKAHVAWKLDGLQEKQEIYINQEARAWIVANRPPSTSPAETYFGFVLQLDVSDIPKWVKNGIQQDIDGDFDDSDTSRVELRDALDRLLAFTPTSFAYSDPYGEDDERDTIRLRKRFWKDGDGNHYLLVGAKVSELNSLHAGGITFDPPWSVQPDAAAGKDNWMLSGAGSAVNKGTDVTFVCNQDGRGGFIEFDASDIPGDATCDSAVLSLWSQDVRTTASFDIYSLHSNVATWTEDGSSWDNYKAATAWPGSGGARTSGTDYEADASPPTIAYPVSAADTEAQADLTSGNNLTAARIAGWFGDPNTNYGLGISLTGEETTRVWHSSDAAGGDVGFRPELTIEYTEAGADAASDSKGGYIRGFASTTDSLEAYIKGHLAASDSKAGYARGFASISSNKPAYLYGTPYTASDSQAAYVWGLDSATSTQAAYVRGWVATSDSQAAYVAGLVPASDSKAAYARGFATASDSKAAYLFGHLAASDSKAAYLRGLAATSDSQAAYVVGHLSASDSVAAYIRGLAAASDSKTGYARGLGSITDSKAAYVSSGLTASDSLEAYIRGLATASGSKAAYLRGHVAAPDSKAAYIRGLASTSDSKAAYLNGTPYSATDSQAAYLRGLAATSDSQAAYARGFASASDSLEAYIRGLAATSIAKAGYARGWASATDSSPAYLFGILGKPSDSKAAYLQGLQGPTGSVKAYLRGIDSASSTKSAFVRGPMSAPFQQPLVKVGPVWVPLYPVGAAHVGPDEPAKPVTGLIWADTS